VNQMHIREVGFIDRQIHVDSSTNVCRNISHPKQKKLFTLMCAHVRSCA